MNQITKTSIILLIILLAMSFGLGQTTDRNKPKLIVQAGHTLPVSSMSFTRNGKFLVTGSRDKTIKLWNIASGEMLHTFTSRTDGIRFVKFLDDNAFIVSISFDNIVELWNVKSGRLSRTVITQTNSGSATVLNSFGNVLAIKNANNKIKIISVYDGFPEFTISHSSDIIFLSLSPDGNILAITTKNKTIELWDLSEKKVRSTINENSSVQIVFSNNGKMLASADKDKKIKLWDVSTGKLIKEIIVDAEIYKLAFSRDDKLIASGDEDGKIKFWDIYSGSLGRSISAHKSILNFEFNIDGTTLVSSGMDNRIKLWDVVSGKLQKTFSNNPATINLLYSPSGKYLASTNEDGAIRLWNFASDNPFQVLFGNSKYVNAMSFNPNETKLAVAMNSEDMSTKNVIVWDTLTGNKLITLEEQKENLISLVFSLDGEKILGYNLEKYIIWDIATGKIIQSIDEANTTAVDELKKGFLDYSSPSSVDFSEKFIANIEEYNKIKILNPNKRELKTVMAFGAKVTTETNAYRNEVILLALGEKDWIVYTPDGLFDGAPNAWKQLLWRFDNTFDYVPVEAFFKEFYRPGLLQDIFNGVPIEAATQDLSSIDIRQPKVLISSIDGKPIDSSALSPDSISADKKSIKVKVEITDNISAPRTGIDKNTSSDAKDVRLFRNGSLIKLWNDNAFKLTEKDGCQQFPATKDSPRKAVCETDVQITSGKNELTVYGFNRQDVKSSDNTAIVNGAESLKRDGTLYVLAIGVNQYKNTSYNLNFAVKDVEDIGKALQEEQAKLGDAKLYAKTEVITLTDEAATKENILAALARFAGGDKTAMPENASDELKKIRQTQPEDAVVIYFAGHGVSRGERFYLLPHDFTGKADLLEKESVSDLELNEYLEKVDAGKILMAIDACQSGQALGGKNDGKAPMNSKGFAQLAYDKGMFILTAAQSQQAALEAVNIGGKEIKHGLLTYALLEALKDKAADKDGDSKLFEKEWFDYATEKVPLLQMEAMKNRSVEIKNGKPNPDGKRGVEIFYSGNDNENDPNKRRVQTPRVFYKRESDLNPFVVARP